MHGDDVTTAERPAVEERARARTRESPAWLRCRACGRRIVLASARIEFDGGHRHRFSNPQGFVFRIGLYDEAPGCSHEGEPTEYFSWFPGFTWCIAVCAACRAHLGWRFECIGAPGPGEPGGFHGLIVDRLQPES